MTLVQDKFKTLEVKVRPFSNPSSQERADQKGASRVHLSKDALLDLRLESGEMCYICKVGEEGELWRKAIAWATNEKSLSKKVVQISKAFQEACSFKLGDELRIGAAVDTLEDAYSIVLEDVTSLEVTDTPELSTEDRGHWEWFLGENLGGPNLLTFISHYVVIRPSVKVSAVIAPFLFCCIVSYGSTQQLADVV